MVGRYARFSIVVAISCIVLATITITAVFNIVNKPVSRSNSYTLELDEAVKLLEEKFGRVFRCVKEKQCNLYAIEVVVIATPRRSGLYDVHIYTNGLNYTRGSIYRDTVTWRSEFGHLSYHISMLIDGVLEGYEEWLDIEKKLGIHLDTGYGVYDRSRDSLSIHIDLPTFKFCEIAHACGEFYLNASLYIDREKYIDYQFTKLNFSYLIDRGYIKLREVENGYAYPINPPAILFLSYIRAPFWRIPMYMIENSTEIPIVIALHIATTNRSILEEYLEKLELFRPLIEASLMRPYISEVARENLTKFVELSDQVNSRAIQKFLEYLHSRVVERLYPGTLMEIKYVENPHGGDYYLARWGNTELLAYIGTLGIHIGDVTKDFIKEVIGGVLKIINQLTSP